ncbi:MAG TPA: hypothetical protein VIH59_31400, partial [Candidatus Tectomicrobia bacterium]
MTQTGRRNTSLLPQGAFVVQFSADTDLQAGRINGRIEHVVSGQEHRFHTLETLLAFITSVLHEVHTTSQNKAKPH